MSKKLLQTLSKDSYPYMGRIRKMSKSEEGYKVVFQNFPKVWFRVVGFIGNYLGDYEWYIYPMLPVWNGNNYYYDFCTVPDNFPEDYLKYQEYLQSFNVPGFKVEWTGEYPSLCYGEWVVSYNGKFLNLPEGEKSSHKGTYKQYSTWSFGEKSGWEKNGIATRAD